MDKNDFRKTLKQDVKEMRRNKIVSALLFVVIGVVLLAWPGETLFAVSKAIGLVLAVGGIAAVVMYFVNGAKAMFSYAGLIGGVIVGVLGLWLFFNPSFLINLIPTIVGIILIISGLVNLSEGLALKKNHGESVMITMILALISVALGAFILVFQQQFAELITRLMGIALVYDGVTDLIMISKLTGIVRTVEYAAKQAAKEAEAVDVTDTVKDVTPEEPVEAPKAEEAPAEEEETPAADGFPVEEPADEAPAAEETPVEEAPAEEEISAEEPPVEEETPTEETESLVAEPDEFEPEEEDQPAEEHSEEGAPAEETSTEESAEETPSEIEAFFGDNTNE